MERNPSVEGPVGAALSPTTSGVRSVQRWGGGGEQQKKHHGIKKERLGWLRLDKLVIKYI